MFISDESCMVGLPGFPGPGRTAWRMVERDPEDFWYHVRFRICEGARARFKKLMPSDPSMLAHLLSQRSTELMIEGVQVVTPPCMNGSPLERMEKLISVMVGCDKNGEYVLLHKVDSGAIYSSSLDVSDAGLLNNIRMIYDATTAAGKHFHCTNYPTSTTVTQC
ncbi:MULTISPECIES: hypothetical protein [unclassified Pseudomonas]|uniref:hypothetical protein n=1 Tax=unclassified Pseudomonas TaxID=196821 RepID=UPI000C86C127|nr:MULTISPECIES: hypothetical protein [unclassified Pseudomonas]PMU25274.1 hypothetical protein C1X90_10515 [Pseudomonas sp. GP01-A9]PMU29718.1 hypothetical protein C1X88_12260 [Pseudomonas sp. GP01-A13]PMU40825.1 hypothetical protein C1X89_11250 [Pseudomonas sp. GP01-A8]PMU49542.1 hypothetical protein C1X87_17225 [Pseudomonas sp. GP01-A14]PMU54198.1 hypothetical protein C1X85_13485 [Pseudomonas sp. GP01-A6]